MWYDAFTCKPCSYKQANQPTLDPLPGMLRLMPPAWLTVLEDNIVLLSDTLKPSGKTKIKEKGTKSSSSVTRGANSLTCAPDDYPASRS